MTVTIQLEDEHVAEDPPSAPSAVTVTVQLEDEPMAEDLYERRRICNQKWAIRRQRVGDRHEKQQGDNYDYSNSDLCNLINIGRDAHAI